jgi:hypothetical protein
MYNQNQWQVTRSVAVNQVKYFQLTEPMNLPKGSSLSPMASSRLHLIKKLPVLASTKKPETEYTPNKTF